MDFISLAHKLIKFLLFLVTITACSTLFAFEQACNAFTWRPVLAGALGILNSSQLGESQNFPIQDPVSDSFYNYSVNNGTTNVKFGDLFLGVELNLWGSGFAFQFGVGYNQTPSVTIKGTLVQGADVSSQDSFNYSYNIKLRQALIEGKLLGFMGRIYHPYIFGGIGAAFNQASDFATTVPPFLTFTRMYASNTVTSFSYALGFGIDFDMDRAFRLGIGYRYSNYGKVELGNASIDTTCVPGTLSQSSLYTNEFFAQATYLFG